jgi:hypothetical protein
VHVLASPAENWAVEQRVQVPVAEVAKNPSPQRTGAVIPVRGHTCPAGHAVHAEVRPTVVEKVPAAHKLHRALFGAAANVPALHVVHVEEPAADAVPGKHAVATSAPAAHALPAGHTIHTAEAAGLYVPAGHGVHDVAPD